MMMAYAKTGRSTYVGTYSFPEVTSSFTISNQLGKLIRMNWRRGRKPRLISSGLETAARAFSHLTK